jgi:hypothetical protein
MQGPEGAYELDFQRSDEWDGQMDVIIAGVAMRWNVDNVEQYDDGSMALGGLTQGSESLWQDCFWFQLYLNPMPVRIEYWGNQVLLRTDYPAAAT